MLKEKFLKVALIGTAQAAPVPFEDEEQFKFSGSPFANLSPETQFLLRTGRHTIYHTAGQIPVKIPAMQSAPEENQTPWTDSLVEIFELGLRPDYQDLLPEFLSLLSEQKINVPEKTIPALLELKSSLNSGVIKDAVGSRGKWLSQFNPDWQWVTASSENIADDLNSLKRIWNEGAFSERHAALESIRRTRPDEGRDLLSLTFKNEKADHRKQLLALLDISLSEADEQFLEQALTDRSKHVKQVAASLLSKIPNTQIRLRNQKRATELLSKQSDSKTFKLVCTPPQELTDEWVKDGFSLKSSQSKGQRASWAEELISKVPLQFWQKHFSAQPIELINGILNDKYAHTVISGWTSAFIKSEDTKADQSWSDSLWKYWSAMLQHQQKNVVLQATEQLGLMVKRIPSDSLSQLITQLLNEQHDPTQLPITEIVRWYPDIWPKKLSHEYLRISRTLSATRSDRAVYEWLLSLAYVSTSLSPELFEAALAPWKIRDHEISAWQVAGIEKLIMSFQERIQMRAKFHIELKMMTQNSNR